MSRLFEPSEINGMMLKNRFVRSATWAGMATEGGAATPKLVELLTRLAQGRVGLIITGHAYVLPVGQAGPWQLGVYDDALVEGLRGMTRAVHDARGRIVLQISHAGVYAYSKGKDEPPMGVSQVEGLRPLPCTVMTVQDIQEIVRAFGSAARRAREAGFDGVQIHGAHGYLLSQFLSPRYNTRTDTYGGSLENRARALVEVYRSVRAAVGDDFPVLVKMNGQDFLDGGLALEDSLQVGRMLEKAGIDAIELSGGTPLSGRLVPLRKRIDVEEKEAYFRREGRAFKEAVRVPLILVGGIRTFELAERLVMEGYADYISMCRPFIREPDLVKRWEAGDRRRSRCVSDSRCLAVGGAGEGIYCVEERTHGREPPSPPPPP